MFLVQPSDDLDRTITGQIALYMFENTLLKQLISSVNLFSAPFFSYKNKVTTPRIKIARIRSTEDGSLLLIPNGLKWLPLGAPAC